MGYSKDEDWARKLKMKNCGMFSTPSYFGVGEPYDDRVKTARVGADGVQMVTNKQRGGITGDNWNNNNGRRKHFKRLYEGEVYVDPSTYDRKWKVEQAKLNLTQDGFRYPRAPQQSSGLGGNWGRIGPKFSYMAETEGKRDGAAIRANIAEKGNYPGFKLNPPKKGYGSSTPGLLFGPGPPKGETAGKIGKEYSHSPDPYDAPRDVVKAERRHQMEAIAGRAPYRTMGASVDFFDAHKRTAAPKGLTEDPIIPAREPPPEGEPVSHLPFYPARAPREGGPNRGGYCFNKMPEYMEDPDEERMAARREEALKARTVGAPFKPTGTKSSKPSRTIVFHQPGVRP